MLAKKSSYRDGEYFLLILEPLLICVTVRGAAIATHTSTVPKMAQEPLPWFALVLQVFSNQIDLQKHPVNVVQNT